MLQRVRSSALHYLTAALLLQLWTLQCLAQANTTPVQQETTTGSDNSTTTGDVDEDDQPTVLPAGAIAGIVVGGAVIVLALLLFFCVCLYCCIRRQRRRGFTPTDKISATQVSNTLTYNAAPADLNGFHTEPNQTEDDKFEMKLNMADDSINPAMSTSLLRESTETRLPGSVLPSTLSPSTGLSLGTSDKGYIKMASAGSVRPSKSVNDLADSRSTEEPDWGIYLNPDQVTVSAGIAMGSNKPSKSSTKPAVSAKPTKAPPAPPVDEESQEDMYVETNVFIEDRQQQESDNYYNSDTIETIRKGRSLIDVVDPVQTHAVYANIDGPPTPEHALKETEEKDDYESVDEFLGNSPNPGTSPPEPSKPADSTEYYNYRHSTDRAEEDDYNYVEVTKPTDVENPYLMEDNQYIYMQSNSGTPTPKHEATPTSKADAKGPHKYINLDYLDDSLPKVDTASGSSHKKPEVMSELHFPTKTTSSEKDKQLYMNLLHEDGGGEELYEELT